MRELLSEIQEIIKALKCRSEWLYKNIEQVSWNNYQKYYDKGQTDMAERIQEELYKKLTK